MGAEFTPTVKDAWATLYSELATTMRAAARGELDGASRAEAQATVFNKAMRHEMGRTRLVAVATALGLVAATAWGIHLKAGSVPAIEPPLTVAAPAPPDPARFLLHALLVPALDGDALPLRWVDPRPASGCGPHTTVHVNGEPLVAGALVPVKAFDLEWQADGCHPLGVGGPRFDGRVKLTVFREDWGFSAMVEPAGAHVTSTDNVTTAIQPGAVTLTQTIERENAVTEMAACAHSSQPCACPLWSQPCY